MAAATSIVNVISFYLASVWYIWFSSSVLFGLATLWFWMERSDTKKYAEDILTRKTCYREKKTLGSITDMAGTKIEFVCGTDTDHPGLAKHKAHTLVNPNLVSTRSRGRLGNGIPTLDYFLPYFFPTSMRSAAALIQTRDHAREHYPNLDWIEDDLDLIKLIFSNNKYLLEDCKTTVTSYMAMGIDIPDIGFDEVVADVVGVDGSPLLLDSTDDLDDILDDILDDLPDDLPDDTTVDDEPGVDNDER